VQWTEKRRDDAYEELTRKFSEIGAALPEGGEEKTMLDGLLWELSGALAPPEPPPQGELWTD
jgi:hypothetical protein